MKRVLRMWRKHSNIREMTEPKDLIYLFIDISLERDSLLESFVPKGFFFFSIHTHISLIKSQRICWWQGIYVLRSWHSLNVPKLNSSFSMFKL